MSTQARSISLPLLDRVHIASPCSARWDDMTGDHIARHCGQCDLDVYNISSMTRDEAESFLQARFNAAGQANDGRVCVRLFRRPDGTLLTADCPVGLAAMRRKFRLVTARIAAALGLTMLLGLANESAAISRIRTTRPFPSLIDAVWLLSAKLGVTQGRPAPGTAILSMGDVCITPPAAATQTGGTSTSPTPVLANPNPDPIDGSSP